jgi:membrane associated rhomboid family serine protease
MAGRLTVLVDRWPWSAAATFVGLLWIGYGWSIWVAEGISRESAGLWFGSLSYAGYFVTGSLDTRAIVEGEWERLVSCIVLHGGFLHLLLNSAAILQLGRILEAFATRGRCFLALMVSGLAGSLATVAWAAITKSPSTSIGASGAACGLGTALVALSHGIAALEEFRKRMITWVVVMLLMGLVPMISGTGHVGGAIGGVVAGLMIRKRGSMRMQGDRTSRGLARLTAALALVFVAALAVNAWRAPERKAAFARVDAMIEDVYVWLDAGAFPPDVDAWLVRAEAGSMPSRARAERALVIETVRALRHDGGPAIAPQDARDARELLAELQRVRRS